METHAIATDGAGQYHRMQEKTKPRLLTDL
jgi:hypothetical protein